MLFAQRSDQVFGNLQRAAHIAQRAARPVADHRGGNGGALAAIFGVDVLDHLFAPLVLKVDVDIRRLVALAADEALKQQRGFLRIRLGNVQAVAHHRIGGRPAALAQNAHTARKANDVVHGEEIHLKLQLRDQRQFVFNALANRVGHASGVALLGALLHIAA